MRCGVVPGIGREIAVMLMPACPPQSTIRPARLPAVYPGSIGLLRPQLFISWLRSDREQWWRFWRSRSPHQTRHSFLVFSIHVRALPVTGWFFCSFIWYVSSQVGTCGHCWSFRLDSKSLFQSRIPYLSHRHTLSLVLRGPSLLGKKKVWILTRERMNR
jgi:hypothetical protein